MSPLNISDISDVPTSMIGLEILQVEGDRSLLDQITDLSRDGRDEGLVVIDDREGLSLGFLLRPDIDKSLAAPLQLIFSLCVSKAVSTSLLVETELEWPGTIIMEGDPVSRVDISISSEEGAIDHLIILIDLSYRSFSRPEEMIRDLLCFLDMNYSSYLGGGTIELLDKWSERSRTIDEHVSIKLKEGSIEGKALGVDQLGSLMLKVDDRIERIPVFDILE